MPCKQGFWSYCKSFTRLLTMQDDHEELTLDCVYAAQLEGSARN